jgi:hypothetical protein
MSGRADRVLGATPSGKAAIRRLFSFSPGTRILIEP